MNESKDPQRPRLGQQQTVLSAIAEHQGVVIIPLVEYYELTAKAARADKTDKLEKLIATLKDIRGSVDSMVTSAIDE